MSAGKDKAMIGEFLQSICQVFWGTQKIKRHLNPFPRTWFLMRRESEALETGYNKDKSELVVRKALLSYKLLEQQAKSSIDTTHANLILIRFRFPKIKLHLKQKDAVSNYQNKKILPIYK